MEEMVDKEIEKNLEKLKKQIRKKNIIIFILVIIIILLLLRCRCGKLICDCGRNSWDKTLNNGLVDVSNFDDDENDDDINNESNIDINHDSDNIAINNDNKVIANQNLDNKNEVQETIENQEINIKVDDEESSDNVINNKTEDKDSNENQNVNNSESKDDSELEKVEELKVTSGTLLWGQKTNLNIFDKYTFGDKKIIWPNLEGNFKFKVENTLPFNINYTIKFNEEKNSELNLKYKLKLGDKYLVSDWTYANEIQVQKFLNKNQDAEYTLEWKWVEQTDELDTSAESSKYRLNIEIRADQL